MRISPLSFGAAALLTLCSIQAAHADELTLAGSTTGTVTGVPQLTFAGNSFTGTTALGVGSLSGLNRLGTFSLATDSLQPLSGSFTLDITFTAPTGINGGQGANYSAVISGSVSPVIDQGGVFVDFTQPTQTFTFNDGINAGSFTLSVADLFVQTGRSADVTAGFTGQQTAIPEPSSIALIGLGVLGFGTVLRRRISS